MSKTTLNSVTENPPLAITMGCPVGIGPEIIIKLFSSSAFNHSSAIVVGDLKLLQRVVREMTMSIQVVEWEAGAEIESGTIPVLPISNLDNDHLTWGRPNATTGKAMAQYIEKAVECTSLGMFSGIVTCPISKFSLQAAGYSFPGHTEMLAHLTSTSQYLMMMAGTRLRVVLVTIHEPLGKVASLLNKDTICNCIEMTMMSLKNDFGISDPKIAVAGFNPHGGENGLFGDEEERVIVPAVKKACLQGEVVGPMPPDTVFYSAANGYYDAVIAMYHDQGLIPFKMLHFDDGVNVTLGLPIVRTSVDHGTAYDLAGKWKASEASLLSAVKMAEDIIFNRKSKAL